MPKVVTNKAKAVKAQRAPHIEYFQGSDKKYYFHLIGSNGEIQCASEGYSSRANLLTGIRDFKINVSLAITRKKK